MALEEPLVVTADFRIDPAELHWKFSRASGPGGQGVNTTDSRVELAWTPAGSPSLGRLPAVVQERLTARLAGTLVRGAVVVVASEHRAQLRNREEARDRLAARLRHALAPPPPRRRGTRPTRGSVERRLQGKRVRSSVKTGRRRGRDADWT